MNKRNILKVAKAIETAVKKKEGLRGEIGFNMNKIAGASNVLGFITPDHVDACGTVACIAGWSYALKYPSTTAKRLTELAGNSAGFDISWRIPAEAAKFLGLDGAEAMALFAPTVISDYGNIAAPHAVAVLRHLAKTGKVDWRVKP